MAWIEGSPDLESSALLLDELWSFATAGELVWTHEWRVGDLVFWDNRCTLHRRDPFPAEERRVMHRTQIKGEAPPMAKLGGVGGGGGGGGGRRRTTAAAGAGTGAGCARAAAARNVRVAVALPRISFSSSSPLALRRCCLAAAR